MKYIVTHISADLDAITSVWLIKRFLQGWEKAQVKFVPAGEKLPGTYSEAGNAIEIVDGQEVVHVDTGLGMLDHHQTDDQNICGARLTYDYIILQKDFSKQDTKRTALQRLVEIVVDNDHFQEVFYHDALSDYHEFSLEGILDGLRLQRKTDVENVEFVMFCLDAIFHTFENRIWAEREIRERGQEFDTRWGKALALETMNDSTLKLAQTMGYVIAVRKDPNNGFVRIKARPRQRHKFDPASGGTKLEINQMQTNIKDIDIDLTPIYEKLREMDANATWFLHVSKKMLLNGSYKNPKMRGTKLSLSDIMQILREY